MKIGELSSRYGIAPSAIRYYEEVGLLGTVDRVGGQRIFEERHARRLAFIKVAQEAGFSLAEVQKMLDEHSPGDAWRGLAEGKASEIERMIRDARRMKRVLDAVASCQCGSLDDCDRLSRALGTSGDRAVS